MHGSSKCSSGARPHASQVQSGHAMQDVGPMGHFGLPTASGRHRDDNEANAIAYSSEMEEEVGNGLAKRWRRGVSIAAPKASVGGRKGPPCLYKAAAVKRQP